MSTLTVARWEFRRLRNYLRSSIRRPVFLTVQAVSIAVIILILWLLWFLILSPNPIGIPDTIRGSLYWVFVQSGLIGPNAIWLVYAIISLIVAQQIVKAMMGVPLGAESEPADVDFLFSAPMQGHVFYTAKYLRSIPRRMMFFLYILVGLQPILWFFGRNFGLQLGVFLVFLLIVFLLGEIGSIATHALYSLRKLVMQPRPKQRLYRIVFYFCFGIGTFLILTPIFIVGGAVISSPMYSLAYILVSLIFSGSPPGMEGNFTFLYYPAIPWVIAGLIFLYFTLFTIARWLSDKITVDLYEEIATVSRKRGTALGFLNRLPLGFQRTKTPNRAILRKDFITGLRKPGKTFFLFGVIANFVFAGVFITLLPTFRLMMPIPSEFLPFLETLYAILLVVIIPLLAINASDPFQGEYGTIYIIRLAPVAPLRFTLIKYAQLLLTPFLLAIPFSIYFAVILGNLNLLPVAAAILPHAILISTAIGVGLGSRYPYASRAKSETPVALMITYPVLSWTAIIPVLIFQLGFLEGGVELMLLSSLLVMPYTVGLMLILLSWSSHSYLRQE